MKRQIRRGCFETNSSSMHSIVITKNDARVTPDEITDYHNEERMYLRGGDDEIVYYGNELYFGRHPFQILCTFNDKLRYVIAVYCHRDLDEEKWNKNYKEILGIVIKNFPQIKNIKIPFKDEDIYLNKQNEKVDPWDIKRNKDGTLYYFDSEGKKCDAYLADYFLHYPDVDGIDHQSIGLLNKFLKKKNIDLEEFLMNKKYVVIIDGDEYYEFEKFKYAGLIDTDNIVERFI